MSFKRILIRIVMMLLLWGGLFAMFNFTQGMSPWIRFAIGLGMCIIYVIVQIRINRKMYDQNNNKK